MKELSITAYHEILSYPPLISFHIERESNGDVLGSGQLTADQTVELIRKLHHAIRSIEPAFSLEP